MTRLDAIRQRVKSAETGEGFYNRRDGWENFVEHAHGDVTDLLAVVESAKRYYEEVAWPNQQFALELRKALADAFAPLLQEVEE